VAGDGAKTVLFRLLRNPICTQNTKFNFLDSTVSLSNFY